MTPSPTPPFADLLPRDLPAWNALASYAGQPIPLAGGALATLWPTAEPDPQTFVAVLAPARGPRLVAALSSFPFRSLLGADLDSADLAVLPPGLAGAIVEGVAALLARVVLARRLGELRLVGLGPLGEVVTTQQRGGMAWWSASVAGVAGDPAALTVGCGARELVALVEADGIGPRCNWPDLRQRLTVDAFPTLGRLALPLTEARRLGPGSVVALPEQTEGTVTLRAGEMLLSLAQAASGWTCVRIDPIDPGTRNHPAASGDQRMSAEPSQGLPDEVVRSIEIVLDFDLGRVAVPIADLEGWAPGTVVPLPLPSPETGLEVMVRANGRVVASGDLVRIDDRIAVRLTRVALS